MKANPLGGIYNAPLRPGAAAGLQLEPGLGKSADAVANCPPLANFLQSYALKIQKPGVGNYQLPTPVPLKRCFWPGANPRRCLSAHASYTTPRRDRLAHDDPYQELVLDPRVKKCKIKDKVLYKQTYHKTLMVGPASFSSTHQGLHPFGPGTYEGFHKQ